MLILSFLTSLIPAMELIFRINRTLGVLRYIGHRPNSYTHARGLQRQGQGTYGYIATVPNTPMARPAKRVSFIKLAIFRGLSGDDASMSVENSNHASSQAVSK